MTVHKEISSKDFDRYTLRLLYDGAGGYIIEQIWKSHGSKNRIILNQEEFSSVYSMLGGLEELTKE